MMSIKSLDLNIILLFLLDIVITIGDILFKYSTFWSDVLKGVGRGLQFSPFGGAINGIAKGGAMKVAIVQLFGKTAAKLDKKAISIVNNNQKQNKIVYFT